MSIKESVMNLDIVIITLSTIWLLFLLKSILLKKKRSSMLTRNIAESYTISKAIQGILSQLSFSGKDNAAQLFLSAGFYNFKYANLFQPTKYAMLLAGGLAIWSYLSESKELMTQVACLSLWVISILLLPDLYLKRQKDKLQASLSSQLPYLLDLMGVCVQTGMTIEASLSYLSEELEGFDKDLAHIVSQTNHRAKIVGLDIALDELQLKVPTTEMRSFCVTLKQSIQYGTSIYSVLTTLASDIREVNMLSLEEKIGKLAAKMSIPLITFIMIPIVILIAAPGVMRMMGNV